MQSLLDALLWDIYGNITTQSFENTESCSSDSIKSKSYNKNHFKENINSWKFSENMLEKQCEYISIPFYVQYESQFNYFLYITSFKKSYGYKSFNEIRDSCYWILLRKAFNQSR